MKFIQCILCRLGRHTRSGSHARLRVDGGYRSVCRICRAPMSRDRDGGWQLDQSDR